jgi:phosphoserine aminotransferase
MKTTFLTPGPSELYFTVEDHLRVAMRENVCSISHRSKQFETIFSHAVSELRTLLQIPENFHIVFTSSANETWERLLQNCVEKESFHLVNGSFSKKFFSFSEDLGLDSTKHEVDFGQGFDMDSVEVPESAELICAIANETSSGVMTPMAEIAKLKERYPDKLLAVDVVSAIPFFQPDFSKVDSIYFSVQKGMGLPAGLGVWIFNEKCVEKSEQIRAKGKSTGTYHSISALLGKSKNNQTPETPNILGIYLLGKICEDMNRKTVEMIRQETIYKSALIYGLLERNKNLEPFITDEKQRSKTVLVANLLNGTSSELIAKLKESNIEIGSGYGKYKESQIRIANFPTHSKEIFEKLYDLLED